MPDLNVDPEPVDTAPAPQTAAGIFTVTAEAEVIRGNQNHEDCEESR